MRLVRVLVCTIIVSASVAAGPVAPTAAAQEVIYVVRHAERVDDARDSVLSADGWARAARLADMLRDAGVTAIFATTYQRTIDTARPLASRLGLQVQSVAADDTPGLIAKVRAAGPHSRVLVVGHSDTVPPILKALGSATEVVIAKGEFDNLFLVLPDDKPGAAPPTVIRLRY